MSSLADDVGSLDTLGEIVRWCRRAPEGTLLDARKMSQLLEQVSETDQSLKRCRPIETSAAELTWRERIWIVPDETRMGVGEVAEALGRAESTVYRLTAAREMPHRKLGGVLVFVAGEVRRWMREAETVEVGAPNDPVEEE